MNGPKPVWMSARKNVNQSRPRAPAGADQARGAGDAWFDLADDAIPSPAPRSSRPPSNSNASVDSGLPPAPPGSTAPVFGRLPSASTPLCFPPAPRLLASQAYLAAPE